MSHTDRDPYAGIRRNIYNLPIDKLIEKDDYKSSEKYLERLKNEFLELVTGLDPEYFYHFRKIDNPDISVRKDHFKHELEILIERFNKCCNKALKPTCTDVDSHNFKSIFFDDDDKCTKAAQCFVETVKAHCDFYRVRKPDRNYQVFREKDMYLISPSLSSKVASARFNLSGYACLYVAESLYIAWEECRRPDFYNANFVRFTNTRDLKVFCLTIPKALNSVSAFFRAYLSLACSAKSNDDDKDHWQYRISNLFIKILCQRKHMDIHGIKYLSSKRFEMQDFRLEYSMESAAYVFPPHQIHEEYDCPKLAKMFEMTQPFSYFFFKLHSLGFKSSKAAITGYYQDTVFAFLENQLKKESTRPCSDFIRKG